tara:strand:- start:169 stop:456 length:288 start_codon:yes stop_codon:yes gene_type:complete
MFRFSTLGVVLRKLMFLVESVSPVLYVQRHLRNSNSKIHCLRRKQMDREEALIRQEELVDELTELVDSETIDTDKLKSLGAEITAFGEEVELEKL